MKAGTAEKLILNMISTTAMIKLGSTYGNLMSNLQLKNEKLRRRAASILMSEFSIEEAEAARLLEETGWDLKTAIVMLKANVSRDEARQALSSSGMSIKRAIEKTPAE
jgi:N-acetylmuramic acid 6-phosphate etherase